MQGRALLFDLDGTLTDPLEGIARCVVHALQALGAPLPDARELRGWIGPPITDSFAAWFAQNGVAATAEQALHIYRERFAAKGLFENTVYPGMPEVLGELAERGFRLFVATSKPGVFARRILDHFDLSERFEDIYGSELDGTRVDKVELLDYLFVREGLDRARSVMIGDREHDMRAARYHDAAALGVLWGFGSAAELHEAGAQWLVAEPRQLLPALLESSPGGSFHRPRPGFAVP